MTTKAKYTTFNSLPIEKQEFINSELDYYKFYIIYSHIQICEDKLNNDPTKLEGWLKNGLKTTKINKNASYAFNTISRNFGYNISEQIGLDKDCKDYKIIDVINKKRYNISHFVTDLLKKDSFIHFVPHFNQTNKKDASKTFSAPNRYVLSAEGIAYLIEHYKELSNLDNQIYPTYIAERIKQFKLSKKDFLKDKDDNNQTAIKPIAKEPLPEHINDNSDITIDADKAEALRKADMEVNKLCEEADAEINNQTIPPEDDLPIEAYKAVACTNKEQKAIIKNEAQDRLNKLNRISRILYIFANKTDYPKHYTDTLHSFNLPSDATEEQVNSIISQLKLSQQHLLETT